MVNLLRMVEFGPLVNTEVPGVGPNVPNSEPKTYKDAPMLGTDTATRILALSTFAFNNGQYSKLLDAAGIGRIALQLLNLHDLTRNTWNISQHGFQASSMGTRAPTRTALKCVACRFHAGERARPLPHRRLETTIHLWHFWQTILRG